MNQWVFVVITSSINQYEKIDIHEYVRLLSELVMYSDSYWVTLYLFC